MPVVKCEECMKEHIENELDKSQLSMCYHKYMEIKNKIEQVKKHKKSATKK